MRLHALASLHFLHFLFFFISHAESVDYTRLQPSAVNYPAEARNYRESPNTLYITNRNGGLAAFNITSAKQFDLLSMWANDLPLEGQDRLGDFLVVTELARGPDGDYPNSSGPKLHFFDLSKEGSPSFSLCPFQSLDLSTYIDAILHVKLTKLPSDELFAVITAGFATNVQGGVIFFNVTSQYNTLKEDTQTPFVKILETGVEQPEGIILSPTSPTTALIGGIKSDKIGIIDFSDVSNPYIVEERDDYGKQLVGAKKSDQPFATNLNENYVVLAQWGASGGVMVLDCADSSNPRIVDETGWFHSLSLSYSNRVKLYKDFILLPLEQPIGGFATVQLGVDGKLGDVQEEHYPLDELGEGDDVVDQSKSYCLAINEGGWVYSFVAETNAVYVYCLYDVAGVNKHCG
mmetsp:Transcript_3976/g.7472  ORF Transcript_3976/g.7472 Transcript_3976/m.7472 type:complete len:404 (-) Transcript_3976:22-1233(-)